MTDSEQANKEVINEIEELKQKIKALEATLRSTSEDFRIVADFTYDWEYWIMASGRLQDASRAINNRNSLKIPSYLNGLSIRTTTPWSKSTCGRT